MLYLNEDDIIELVAEKHKVEPEDVTLKIDLAASRVTAIVDKRREDDDLVFVIKKDHVNPETWEFLMRMTNEGNAFHIFEKIDDEFL